MFICCTSVLAIDPQNEQINSINENELNELNATHLFDQFKIDYNRHYASKEDHDIRYNIFKENLLRIKELNINSNGTATYGITQFADVSAADFQQRSCALKFADEELEQSPHNITPINRTIALPRSFNWREHNVITPVKQQGICGACWAFSAVGAIEAMHAITAGGLDVYSEQQLVDCDKGNNGCAGGDPVLAFGAVYNMGGLEYQNDYPYKAQQQLCLYDRGLARVAVKSANRLPQDEEMIAQYVMQHGPVVMGINSDDMQHYHSGVSHPSNDQCKRNRINHYVLAVGFGTTDDLLNPLPYWIIKNSWGVEFGEVGYYYIYRGDNSCGVSFYTSIVTVA